MRQTVAEFGVVIDDTQLCSRQRFAIVLPEERLSKFRNLNQMTALRIAACSIFFDSQWQERMSNAPAGKVSWPARGVYAVQCHLQIHCCVLQS